MQTNATFGVKNYQTLCYQVEPVHNPRTIYDEEKVAQYAAKKLHDFYYPKVRSNVQIGRSTCFTLTTMIEQPYTLKNYRALRKFIDDFKLVVPDHLNYDDVSNLVLITREHTISLNDHTLAALHIDNEILTALETSCAEYTFVGISKQANDAINRVIKKLTNSTIGHARYRFSGYGSLDSLERPKSSTADWCCSCAIL